MENQVRILLADDEEGNRKLLGRLLERQGFVQKSVASGQDAISDWQAGDWDILVLDVMMPGMGGLEVARTIRQEEAIRGGRIPIFALTAGVDEDERAACLEAGMDAVLAKPLRIEVLVDLVRSALVGREYTFSDLVHAENEDEDFARELIRVYLKNESDYVGAMLRAAENKNACELKKSAHKLRGALAIIRAGKHLIEIIRKLEESGSTDNMGGVDLLATSARMALAAFSAGLKALPGISG